MSTAEVCSCSNLSPTLACKSLLSKGSDSDNNNLEEVEELNMSRKHGSKTAHKGSASPPNYLRWAESIDYLLDDASGVQLFKSFLESEGNDVDLLALEFCFAVNGFKSEDSPMKMHRLMKLIMKKYLRGDLLTFIKFETRKTLLARRSSRSELDALMFDEARDEVLAYLRANPYSSFLHSEHYIRYVDSGGQLMPLAAQSHNSRSLPTVHEDLESYGVIPFATEHTPQESGQPPSLAFLPRSMSAGPQLDLTPFNLKATQHMRKQPPDFSVPAHHHVVQQLFVPNAGPSLPYHSYAPTSKQDSELQSASSDALTDDTMSMTDTSSLDNYSSNRRYMRRAMRRSADTNREENPRHIIPRPQHPETHGDHDLAVSNPSRFASILSEKLSALQERESLAKSADRRNPEVLNSPWALRLLMEHRKQTPENPELILDEHLDVLERGRESLPQWKRPGPGSKGSTIDSGIGTVSGRSNHSSKSVTSSVVSQKQLNQHVTTRAWPLDVPRQPFMTDRNMQLMGSPNPEAQVHEVRRRLEDLTTQDPTPPLTVGYFMPGEQVPYRTTWQGREITLGQFKHLIAKKGHYRFYFKKRSDEFVPGGAVHEEMSCDDDVLPLWEGKVIAKIEKVD